MAYSFPDAPFNETYGYSLTPTRGTPPTPARPQDKTYIQIRAFDQTQNPALHQKFSCIPEKLPLAFVVARTFALPGNIYRSATV